MLPSSRRRRSRARHHRHPRRRHQPRLLRSPSFLVTSVAAIGGLSAIGAVPLSDPTGHGEDAAGQVAGSSTTSEALSTELDLAVISPHIVEDAVGTSRPVEQDSLTLLGSGQELPSLNPEGSSGAVGETSRYDVLDPAEFVAFGTQEAADEDAEEPAGSPAEEPAEEAAPLVYEGADGERIDPDRIRAWLEGRGYPLADYADELVAAGVEHGVDPRLIVGIAVIESSGGKRLPPSTHNAWGWSGNGPHGLKSWPSWPEAIDGFTEGLARVYDTDNVDERMARKYVPPNWEKWLRTVRWVINDI